MTREDTYDPTNVILAKEKYITGEVRKKKNILMLKTKTQKRSQEEAELFQNENPHIEQSYDAKLERVKFGNIGRIKHVTSPKKLSKRDV